LIEPLREELGRSYRAECFDALSSCFCPDSASVLLKYPCPNYSVPTKGADGEGDPDAWISVGSLDHPEDWPMTKHASWGKSIHVFIDTKIPWYEINDGLPQRESDVLAEAARAYVARTSQ
jgi:hypothetical protein